LALARNGRDHLLHIVDEAHVKHAVGLVQHEELQLFQVDVALVHQVQQATGSGHEDVHAAAQGIGLWLLAHATEDHGGAQVGMVPVSFETFVDLDGQFPRGRKDERPDGAATAALAAALAVHHELDHGDGERGRFAGAGLRAT
jgi:hypothetical protein